MKIAHGLRCATAAALAAVCVAPASGALAQVQAPAQAPAQAVSPLIGDWRASDGAAVARLAPCANGPGICATVIDSRPAPGEASALGQVIVSNLVPTKGVWRGRYGAPGENLSARVRLVNANTIDLRVCAGSILCESARYMRIRK